jgi:hypothetical protein
MHCAPRIALVTFFLVACSTALGSGAGEVYGSLTQGVMHSAANDSGFPCQFGTFGIATHSHATISDSGNQTLHCSGKTAFTGEPVELEDFPCPLHYEGEVTTDSRFSINPSGQAHLMCQSKASDTDPNK